MGHIINPILYRLGYTRTWNSAWSSNNFINYSYLINRDLFLYNFLKLFFQNKKLIYNNFVYSHSKIIYLSNGTFNIINYIYFSSIVNDVLKLYNILKKRDIYTKIKYYKLLKKYNNLDLINKREFIINDFINKFYKFIRYYLVDFIIIKPIFYGLILLNIIIKNWLKMITIKFKLYNISYIFLNLLQITSYIITYYIIQKLKQRNLLLRILKPIFKNLENNNLILGYKICCSGRLTRKQRATYYWIKKDLVSFNCINSVMDYSYKNVTLRFGICGIKVWLCKKI